MQQPFTGSLIDTADSVPKEIALEIAETQFRILIGASMIGTAFGIILSPSLHYSLEQSFIYQRKKVLFLH